MTSSRPASWWLQRHDAALAQAAFALQPLARRRASAALQKLAAELRAGPPRASLSNTGLPGSEVVTGFSFAALRRLTQLAPKSLRLEFADGSLGDSFDRLFESFAPPALIDSYRDDPGSAEEWLRAISGGSELDWLLTALERCDWPSGARELLWDDLDLTISWRLERVGVSRAELRLPPVRRAPRSRKTSLASSSPRELIESPLPLPAPLSPAEKRRLGDLALLSLAVRGRETDPVTNVEPAGIERYTLEPEIDVLLFPLAPAQRLPYESYIGFMAAKRSIPVAYGGAWIFFDRAAIGINIFPEFRGTESRTIFSQILRVYAQRGKIRRFVVDPYQFGRGNREAIRSGAFWFYWGLGFRPLDEARLALAEREQALKLRDPRHRSPAAVLRRLAQGEIGLELEPSKPVPTPSELSQAVASRLECSSGGDVARAERELLPKLASRLGLRDPIPAPARALALAAATLPDLERWSRVARHDLAVALREKNGASEWNFLAALQRNDRLRRAWNEQIAASAHRIAK